MSDSEESRTNLPETLRFTQGDNRKIWLFLTLRVTFIAFFALLAACAPAATPPAQLTAVASSVNATLAAMTATPLASQTPAATVVPEARPTLTLAPLPTATPSTPTPDTRLNPVGWASWPVVPKLSGRAAEIYRQGLARGSDPRSFSTVGDCQSEPAVFMGIYATNRYWLGKDYQHLQESIDFFKDSFPRQSLAVRDGLSAPSALTAKWADPKLCQANESPVECDLRVHKPSIMFVNLGTNWRADASVDAYEKYLRQIIDLIIANGTLPILSTKADNIEGGNRINLATARVAYDYDIPLWNLWLAVQDMPNHGLDPERKDVYLSVDAWDRRNFTALMTLDALRRALRPIYEQSQPR